MKGLYVPSPRPLARKELIKELAEHTSKQSLTIVMAPMGYGKTVTARVLADTMGASAFYFAIPPRPLDIPHLWIALCTLLQTREKRKADSLYGMKTPTSLIRFFRSVESHFSTENPAVLALDNFQHLGVSGMEALLRVLTGEQARGLRVVAFFRPDARLNGVVMKNRAVCFPGERLRFSRDEVHEYFTRNGIHTPDAPQKAWEISEGWPALVHAALESWQVSEEIRRTPEIESMLAKSVLGSHPKSGKAVLQRLSALDAFTTEDVVELTGHKGKAWFDRLSVDKTLVLSAHPDAFRFHAIIRNHLLGELAVSHRKRLPGLLHRAGNCYQKRGDLIAAFHSFIQAGRDVDLTRALGLFLLPEATRIPSRRIHEIYTVVQSIPTRIRAKQPVGYLAYLRLLISAGGGTAEMKWRLSEAESLISSGKAISPAMRRRLHGEIAIMNGILAFNDMPTLWQWYDQARAFLQGRSQIHPRHVAWHFGCPHLSHLCLPKNGKYKEMIGKAAGADETASVLSGESVRYGDVLGLEYHVERGDVQMAWKCLERFADKIVVGAMSEVQVCFSHARLLLLEGRAKEAIGILREIHLRTVESDRMDLALCAGLGLDYIHSCLGQAELVSGWIRDGDFLSQSTDLEQRTAFVLTVYGKTLLAAGKYERLLVVSRTMQRRLDIHDKLLCRIHACILEAICFLNLEGLTPAVNSMRIALDLARPSGVALSFAEYGRHITTLLRRAMKKTETRHYQRILALSECFRNHSADVSKCGRDTFSFREREIMRLIAKGMSNRAIGHELGITERTVRDVLSRVYSQLGVSNRTRAAYLYELHYTDKDLPAGSM